MTAFTARRISARVKCVGFCGAFCTATILPAALAEEFFADFFMGKLWNLGRPDARRFMGLATCPSITRIATLGGLYVAWRVALDTIAGSTQFKYE